jgi:hypothetical protein
MPDDQYVKHIKKKHYGGKKFWLLVLDDCMDKGWSFFLKHKDNQVEELIAHIKELKSQYGKVEKYICCDNAGENILLEEWCKKDSESSLNTPAQIFLNLMVRLKGSLQVYSDEVGQI